MVLTLDRGDKMHLEGNSIRVFLQQLEKVCYQVNILKKNQFQTFSTITYNNESLFNEQLAWETPEYITNNMVHTFRYYQDPLYVSFITPKLRKHFVLEMYINYIQRTTEKLNFLVSKILT